MDPLTIALLAGAGLLVFFGLRGTANASASSPAQQATDQGAQIVVAGGSAYGGQADQLQQVSSSLSGKELTTGISAAGAGAGAGLTAAGTAGTSAGIVAGAVTAGIGAVVGLAAILWAKHEARIKGAKTENAAMNLIYPGWAESIQGIVAAYNSGQITDVQAIAELKNLKALVYNSIVRYAKTPGVNWSGGGSQPGLGSSQQLWSVKCDKRCTIGCCLFNGVIGPETNNTIALISHKQIFKADSGGMVAWSATGFNVPKLDPVPQYGFKGYPLFHIAVTK